MEYLKSIIPLLLPELLLVIAASVLFLLGISTKVAARRAAPWISIFALGTCCWLIIGGPVNLKGFDSKGTFEVSEFSLYIKLLVCAIGILLTLLAWPTNHDATGNAALSFGGDAGEFFALMLLSLAGVLMVSGANDMILLFLGIELASIPTYIMVSVSRPVAAAQEAGVKYFFLGAMAAALMLFGFSYLYGTTGTTNLYDIGQILAGSKAGATGATSPTTWQILAMVMLLLGFGFKLAAVPLHFYAGDVYQGAATPVTAFLSFVPKITGIVAIIKLLWVYGGNGFAVPEILAKLLFAIAIMTMFAGNLLGLMQLNVKRVMAYSSIAHSGYLLVGLTALAYGRGSDSVQNAALQGVLFYIAAYGIMNVGVFAVLQMLPSRDARSATSAETFEDLAGQGRKHVALGLAMAVGCFSLIGLPLTVGFFGKLYLIIPAWNLADENPALRTKMAWLIGLTMLNAAISAGYYLKIVGTMFLRAEPPIFGENAVIAPVAPARSLAPTMAVVLATAATIALGTLIPATQLLSNTIADSLQIGRQPLIAPAAVSTAPEMGTPAALVKN